jgi:D-methionine transport system ATP-binding protein
VKQLIDIKNLCKVYKTREGSVEALKDINLSIENGDVYGIIGLSGAGKSSLLRCINLLEKPTSGEILIEGIDILKLSERDLRETRKRIGMIFQHFNLLMNSTVYDNIAFPLRISKLPEEKISARVNELLEIVGLQEKKDSYPSSLSGGQKQRVGIARALANNPNIILCDEATSALDPTTTESILELLRNINKSFGITIVVVTHEMDVIKHLCHRVAVVEEGQLVEEGSVVEIFSNPASATSRKFLRDTVTKLPTGILKASKDGSEKLIKVYFVGESASKPFISQMVKQFDVDANIITGNIETIEDYQVGCLIIKVSGKPEMVNSAVNYLIENNLRVEVIENEFI